MAEGPYRDVKAWSLVRTRGGGPPGSWLFWLAGAALAVVTVVFGWMLIWGVPQGVTASPGCAALFLVPFTLIWFAGLVANQRAQVSFFREGIVVRSPRVETIAWEDIVALRRSRQDPEVSTPPGWVIATRDGKTVHLPGWLVEKSDLAPLVARGFSLPDEGA